MSRNLEAGDIAIVRDSASALPKDYQPAINGSLFEAPLNINISINGIDKQWTDHYFESDEERAEFIQDLQAPEISTSQPEPKVYMDIYRSIIESGVSEIAVIPMSSAQGGSMQSAILAASATEFRGKANINVADCKSVSLGQALLVAQADVENGEGRFENAEQLVSRVNDLSKGVYLAQAFSDLKHLERGGRASFGQAVLGGALNVKQIMTQSAEGKLEKLAKRPGWNLARKAIVNHVLESVNGRQVRLALAYFETDQLDNLRDNIKGKFTIATKEVQPNGDKTPFDILVCEQRMVLSAHSGLGVVALGALVLDNNRS